VTRAAAIGERLQIRIERVDHVRVQFFGTSEIAREFERLLLPFRIAEHEEPEMTDRALLHRKSEPADPAISCFRLVSPFAAGCRSLVHPKGNKRATRRSRLGTPTGTLNIDDV